MPGCMKTVLFSSVIWFIIVLGFWVRGYKMVIIFLILILNQLTFFSGR